MKTLVVFPMQQEFNAFLRRCRAHGLQAERATIGRLPVQRLPALQLALARGGTGKAQFAVHTQHLLDHESFDLVIGAGTAGALIPGVKVGDVVVATVVVEHDYANKFGKPALPCFRCAPRVVTRMKRVSPGTSGFRVHVGRIASGDEDIIDIKTSRRLHDVTGALAVAWEGAGGARAAAFEGVPYVEVRGITDTADHHAAVHFWKNLASAMEHVAIFLMAWLVAEKASL